MRRFCLLFCLLFALPAFAVTPGLNPPETLKEWFDYARKRYPPEDCPTAGGRSACVVLTEVTLEGRPAGGSLKAVFTGRNLSPVPRAVALLGPASLYTLSDPQWTGGEGGEAKRDQSDPFFRSGDGAWMVRVGPGDFTLEVAVSFAPKPVLPMTLAEGIGRLRVNLEGARMEYDETAGLHGGAVQIVSGGSDSEEDQPPQIRVTRVIRWGAVPTFSYHVEALGLKKDAPVAVSLLSGEVVESLSPERPYRLKKSEGARRRLETTLSPSVPEVAVRGHYSALPGELELGTELPFEVWLYVADARHPAEVKTNARPIDPAEFGELADVDAAKAFLVKPGEHISFTPLALTVDEGRRGKARLRYEFIEGARGRWLEKLKLNAEILGQDRLVIPTPAPPSFAGIGGDGMELYHDAKGRLSVRLPPGGLGSEPIEVHWNTPREPVRWLGLWRTELPPQEVFVEEQNASIRFRPGVVPLLARGADSASGDLPDQFHLYGLLLGILVFFVCRGLKFPAWMAILTALLFITLYPEEAFPTTAVLCALVVTLPWALLSDGALEAVRRRSLTQRLLLIVWAGFYLAAAVPLTQFARERVYQALHPEAGFRVEDEQVYPMSGGFAPGSENAPPAAAPRPHEGGYGKKERAKAAEAVFDDEILQIQQPVQYQQVFKRKIASSEYNTKTVRIQTSAKFGREVGLNFYHLVQGSPTRFSVLVAGPWARGTWLIAESGLILVLMVGLLRKGRRLWAA